MGEVGGWDEGGAVGYGLRVVTARENLFEWNY